MQIPATFSDNVKLKFRLYSGLLNELPFDYTEAAATVFPLFARECRERLAAGDSPRTIVDSFFHGRMEITCDDVIRNRLFDFVHFIERQMVLFDAVEDAAFTRVRDMADVGTLHEAAGRISAQNLADKARTLFEDFSVRIVLTAHPTQFYTEPVLRILSELQGALESDHVQEVRNLLLQLGHTRFSKKDKPKPFDEARGVLWYMEHILYSVVPSVHADMLSLGGFHFDGDKNLALAETALTHRSLIEIGFWPGGDRDGNPFVDAATTIQVGELLRRSILGLYLTDLRGLARRLTFDGVMDALDEIIRRMERTLVLCTDSLCASAEVSRIQVSSVQSPDQIEPYQGAAGFRADLLALRSVLVSSHNSLFLEILDNLIVKVTVFGFHFAGIDVRQDSRVLARAADSVLSILYPGAPPFSSLSQEQRIALLGSVDEESVNGLSSRVLETLEDPVLRDCFEVFSAIRLVQERNGGEGLNRFIISNTRGPADPMTVRFLALCTGCSPQNLPLDIVPLFETVEDLEASRPVMARLWSEKSYARHLEARGRVQHIMLGFSDGTKDGGYLSANWQIYRAKQGLTALARETGFRLVFFDGRGGPPARGGGNTHKFYRSLGRDIEGRAIHLTIQGQTISSTYGTVSSARYNLEQLATAALDNSLYPQNEDWHLDCESAKLLDELSAISFQAYRELRDDPDFLPYLQHLSPLLYYGKANNSSRPAKRPGKGPLTLGDLRAIPFVGAWSQIKLNIPAYYGLGTALHALETNGRLDELRDLYCNSLYFRTLVENSMQSLSKVHLPLTDWVLANGRFGSFHRRIVDEAVRTRNLLLRISGQTELLETDPVNRASIALREELILPMAVIQQYALECLRSSPAPEGKEDEVLEKLVLKTMAVSINASRNSV